MKFRTRLTIAAALLVLLIISVELLISYLGATRNDERVAVRNLKAISRQVGNTLNLLLHQAARDLTMISRWAYLNEPSRSKPAVNQRLIDFRDSSPAFSRLTFYDAGGSLRADSDADGSRPHPSAADLLRRGLSGKSGFLVQAGTPDALPRLLFFAPVRLRADEKPKGVVVGTVLLDQFGQLLDYFQSFDMAGPHRLTVHVTDQAGLTILASEGYSGPPAAAPVSVPPAGEQAILDRGSDLQIITPITGLQQEEGHRWQLQVTVPKAQIYAEARSRLVRKIAVNTLMCSLGVLAIWLLAGRLSRPLEDLSAAVRRRGAGDTGALEQLPQRQDEFALLQQSLQEMSANLQESMELLRLSEERFHALFDTMAEGAALHRLVSDPDGTPVNYLLLEVNRSFQSILGIPREAAVGRLATEVYQCAAPPYLQEYAEVASGGPPCCFETYFAPLERHFSISVCPTGPGQFATMFSDITAKKWHEDQLRSTMAALKAANEAKSRFLAVMSHEIRTPLNGITGMVQLLRDMEMPPLQRELLDNIDTSAESLLNVINDILDFSKIEAGRMELEQIPFAPAALFSGTLRVLRLRAQAKGLQLTLVCDPGMPHALVGDPHRLGQVLTNLVNNAIKFTVGGEITIRAGAVALDQQNYRLTVSVRDPGIGMDEATQRTIFEPYIQADSSTTRRFGGTGLGLAICKQLVELMQGGISVESRPGDGSTFTFWVPLKHGVLPRSAPESAAPVLPDVDQPLRILVAEDQPVNQRFVAEILRKQGHTPLLAGNGQEAVEIWTRDSVDLILMDIQMPVLDGLKALAAIRAAEDGTRRHTPIIALTAHAIVGDRERLLEAGFDGYLSKPLQAAALFEAMARALELIRQERRP